MADVDKKVITDNFDKDYPPDKDMKEEQQNLKLDGNGSK